MASNQENQEKLDYAARLSGLLLNEGTDVMHWFLLDNLPRIEGEEPNLATLMEEKRTLFQALLDDAEKSEQLYYGQEMYDILFPPHGVAIDLANMEISLIFILIRYLCKIKHSSWKWWEEDPQSHQRVPVFDVIRLARFKTKMKDIVQNYEITKESYDQSLKYLMNLIERLRGYKISTRRWKDDMISYEEDETVTKERKTIDFVNIMRWQTLPMKERNAIYLVHKKNFYNMESGDHIAGWRIFISCFGQMKSFAICHVNELQEDSDEQRILVAKANNIAERSYLELHESPAKILNWHTVHDTIWKSKMQDKMSVSVHCSISTQSIKGSKDFTPSLTTLEKQIYHSVDDRIFVTDSPSESPLITKIREGWKSEVVKKFRCIPLFPFKKEDEIHMDEVKVNVSTNTGALTSWTEMFRDSTADTSLPLRIIIRGPPCYGKTTILEKIAYHCATKNCPQLQQYDIIFYIDLSKVKLEKPYTRMVDCINRQSFGDDVHISSDELENVLRSSSGRGVLFLFDAIDQFPICEETSEICDVIKSHLWSECGIVVAKGVEPYRPSDDEADILLNESRIQWKGFQADGFKFDDVIKEVHHFHGKRSEGRNMALARHALNLMRVYQKDVYTGQTASPVLTSVICSAWKETSREKDDKASQVMPETFASVLDVVFARYFASGTSEMNKFEEDVLNATLKTSKTKFKPTSDDRSDIGLLLKLGVIRKVSDAEGTFVTFVHPLLRDFFCAKINCSKNTDFFLKEYLSRPEDALRLRYFLINCSKLNIEQAEEILDILSNLVQADERHVDDILQLCLHCFYASALNKSSKGHRRITSSLGKLGSAKTRKHGSDSCQEADDSDLITTDLELIKTHELSNRTRQSLLKFVGACRPCITKSGTVFPLLRACGGVRTTSYIRTLHISEIRQSQAVFVSSIISRLPFLDAISLTDIESIFGDDFKIMCNSLKPGNGLTSSLHFLKITFKCATHFDLVKVPTYEALGAVLPQLPFLESLNIEPLTFRHFTSIYGSSKITVPLKEVQLSRCNITDQQCRDMSRLLSRSLFVTSLDFSLNPIHGGLSEYYDAFAQFRTLKTVNFEQCCLSSSSLLALSSCFTAPRLSRTVTSINLRANHIDDQEAWLSLAKSLGHLMALRCLNLSQNFLRDRVICVLASQLHKMKELRQLILDYVEMRDLGFSAMRTAISSLGKLEVLSLGENPLRVDALELLPDLVDTDAKTTHSLTEIKISGISGENPLRVTPKGVKHAVRALPHFKNLTSLDLTNTKISYSDAVTILQAAEDHEILTELVLTDGLVPLTDGENAAWTCLRLDPKL